MLSLLKDFGITSDHLYAAGFASIGLAFATWGVSKLKASDSRAQADRWGLFVGEWTPTFFALGIALKLEEQGGLPRLGKH
jgi:hypothetical protein